MPHTQPRWRKGAVDMLPLAIAVIPWGILAGSVAIQAGLPMGKAIAMSALVFAGAAQLVSLGLVMAGASTLTILVTVYLLTTQHLIYALSLRPTLAAQPWSIRLGQAFLLTDEQFALSVSQQHRSISYLFGSGLCFYLIWVASSLLGIVFASVIPNLKDLHLDFSIVAIFIPMIIALVKDKTTAFSISITLLASIVLKLFHIDHAMLIAALVGMLSAVCIEKIQGAHA
ncbi:4-azaleucine resistance transporter AzlC [Acinetobacter calcoaceticus]|uniref:4-azaleucine resistance transporter AzlC n=1 Tax=Acinetobacter calcoaceticus TaxID=471 RepID=A0A4R1Y0X6_ACICA|nr:4-azaleucine resistance transporter AzlC [Acinetobacter calcoaceticus]